MKLPLKEKNFLQLKSFIARDGRTYVGTRYPRKGAKDKKYSRHFFVEADAASALREIADLPDDYTKSKLTPIWGQVWDGKRRGLKKT